MNPGDPSESSRGPGNPGGPGGPGGFDASFGDGGLVMTDMGGTDDACYIAPTAD